MRRFIHAITIAGLLVPAMASAHGEDAVSAGTGTTGTTSTSGTNGTLSDRNNTAGTSSTTAPAPLPFRNSILIIDNSITPETVFAGAQQSYQPSFETWVSFRPRWYFTDTFSLRGRFDVTTEWTNWGETTHTREPVLGDPTIDAAFTGIPTFAGIQTSLGLGVGFPLSLASRFRGNYFTLRASAGLTRKFEHVGPGDLSLGLSFVGMHGFSQYTNGAGVNVNDPNAAQCTGSSGGGVGDLPSIACGSSGTMNTAFTLWSILSAGYSWRQLSFNLSYVLINNWAYGTPDTTIPGPGGAGDPVTVPHATDDTRMRQMGWFLVSVDYEIVKWLSASLGYYVYRPIQDPDAHIGNPFWSPGGNSRVFLTATFNLDSLYDAVTGRGRQSNATAARRTNVASNAPTTNEMAHQAHLQSLGLSF